MQKSLLWYKNCVKCEFILFQRLTKLCNGCEFFENYKKIYPIGLWEKSKQIDNKPFSG